LQHYFLIANARLQNAVRAKDTIIAANAQISRAISCAISPATIQNTAINRSGARIGVCRTWTTIVDVPEMIFIMVDGAGNPNTSESYKTAIEILYGLSYFIRMSTKGRCRWVILINDPRKAVPKKN